MSDGAESRAQAPDGARGVGDEHRRHTSVVTLAHQAVRVPATSANLGPGFDAFGVALDRHLLVTSVARASKRVDVDGEGAGELDDGEGNLVWRALTTFCARFDAAVPEVSLRVRNDIPLERGLGSSSAAIIAGLALGRVLTGAAVADTALVELATELEGHPDNVAPALLGGMVACVSGDDGRLVMRRAQPAARLRPVVLVPTARQATTAARAVLPETLERAEVATQAARAGHVLAALLGAWPAAAAASGDRLHEPARLATMPGSAAVVTRLRDAGVHAWLSGAGPAVVAAVPSVDVELIGVCERVGGDHGFVVQAGRFDLAGAVTCPVAGVATNAEV